MSSNAKPIPAFYCCYLLRSTERLSVLYVGSTPDPQRRLAQHNGDAKGGAIRTARHNLRPWEMTCIVAGFPSNIAALQFEWAWQNAHLTKRISDGQRITIRKTIVSVSPRTGRVRRRPTQPRASMVDRLSNLHLLLRVSSFTRLPLEVRFFCKDVYDVWVRWSERADEKIQNGIRILLDLKQPEESTKAVEVPKNQMTQNTNSKGSDNGGVHGVDVGYTSLKGYLEKSLFLLAGGGSNICAVCTKDIGPRVTMVLVCSHENCRSAFHLTCLAQSFLKSEREEGLVLPKSGTCPQCKLELQWIDLVKEMSLRIRGEREVARLMKRPRVRQIRSSKHKIMPPPNAFDEDEGEDDTDSGQGSADDDSDTLSDIEDPSLSDWRYLEDEDDRMSITSTVSNPSCLDVSSPVRSKAQDAKLGTVIEDSDWDDAEILD